MDRAAWFDFLSHHPFIRKAKEAAVADDDMVQYLDAHEFACRGQLVGKLFIFRAGHNIATGMIVNADHCRRKFLEG